MKKLTLSLLCVAALSVVPATAGAVATQVPYDAFITNGPLAIPVGTWFFDLDNDIPGVACRFFVEWDNNAILPLSSDCYVDEAKVHGAAGCVENSITPSESLLTLDPHFGCSGFDRFQQFHAQVALLMLGEDITTGGFFGLIQFTPATSMVNGFNLTPVGAI